MFKKFGFIAAGIAAAAIAMAVAPGLKLTPGTIGNGAVAKWEVLRNGPGKPNQVLRLEKMVATTEYEAAGADIGRIAGTEVSDLTLLDWTVVSGTLNGGSPRWNIYLDTNNSGVLDAGDSIVFLDHNSAGAAGGFDNAEILAAVAAAGGNASDKILYLQIIVDVQGGVVLDDIKVGVGGNVTTFGGPGNSGN